MEVGGQIHAPAALPPRESPRYPWHRRLDWLQNLSEDFGEEKTLALPGIEPGPSLSRLPYIRSTSESYALRSLVKQAQAAV
jgi:hypothetical protein